MRARFSKLNRWITHRLSLSEQFLLLSFIILLAGMLLIGWWVANRIQNAVVSQTSNVTALYMKSFVQPLLQPLTTSANLDNAQHLQLQRLMTSTPFGQDIVSMKVWSPDGKILFSLQPSLIGSTFPVGKGLQTALTGQTVSRLSPLDEPDNQPERQFATQLIETYVPVFATGTNHVIAVAEFYQYSEPLLVQIADSQRQSWVVVGIATMLMYGLLSGIVSRGSQTIDRQQTQLQQSVKDLSALLEENRILHHRLQEAAARETEINEQVLHRIGRDLHDGPAQDLALALLRLDEVGSTKPEQLETIRHALRSALQEIRSLAAGLQLPELESLDTADVARRAVREFQRKTGATPGFEMDETLPALSLSKKIAIYRAITEALFNSFRHADGKDLHVRLGTVDQSVCVEIKDSGPGFDPSTVHSGGDHLGLAGLQQRIALLAGTFDIRSSKETGTQIRVRLPLKEG